MNKNIVLTGMRGSGKSMIGRYIAKILGRKFVDLDKKITQKIGMGIPKIVEKNGWGYFRELEKKTAKIVSKMNNIVISTGGGTIIDTENEKILGKNGYIIFLHCDINALKQRLKGYDDRPSLTGKDFLEELEEIFEKRKKRYEESADLIFDVSEQSEDKTKDLRIKGNKLLSLLPKD